MKKEPFEFTIRPEQISDIKEIYELTRIAFETAEVKDGDEQEYVLDLRNSERYILELALIAEYQGKLIGHIMLTRTMLIQPHGDKIEILLLSPVSVLLEYRNRNVGKSLIEESCRLASRFGYKAVVLCGDPGYYTRFDFRQSSIYGITSVDPIPEQYVLIRELEKGFLDRVEGWVECC